MSCLENLPNELLMIIINYIGCSTNYCEPLKYVFNLLSTSRRFLFLQDMRYTFFRNAYPNISTSKIASYVSTKLNGIKDGPEYIFYYRDIFKLGGYKYFGEGKLLNNHIYLEGTGYYLDEIIIINYKKWNYHQLVNINITYYDSYILILNDLASEIKKGDPHIFEFVEKDNGFLLHIGNKKLQTIYDIEGIWNHYMIPK